jgi:hypothetical protein
MIRPRLSAAIDLPEFPDYLQELKSVIARRIVVPGIADAPPTELRLGDTLA